MVTSLSPTQKCWSRPQRSTHRSVFVYCQLTAFSTLSARFSRNFIEHRLLRLTFPSNVILIMLCTKFLCRRTVNGACFILLINVSYNSRDRRQTNRSHCIIYTFILLFTLLSPDNIALIIEALFAEQRILVTSQIVSVHFYQYVNRS